MALSYDQLSAITEKKFVPKLVDNIFNSSLFLKKLKEREESQDGGERIVEPLEYAQNGAGGWYQGADTLDTSDTEVFTAAEFDWKQLYDNISITRRDELRNKGDAQKVNFVKSKIKNAEKTIRDRMAVGCFNSGTDAKAILGVNSFLSTSATYGGISQSSYSWWQAQVDSTTTTLTLAAMQALWGDIGNGDAGEYPELVLGDQDMYDRYYNLLQPQQRFADADAARGGFVTILFNGKPFVVDSHATAGDLYMLNLDYLKLKPHREENFRFEPFMKPINQNVKVAKIYWMGALTCCNNRRQGKLDAITA
jgi:hypothetical protein